MTSGTKERVELREALVQKVYDRWSGWVPYGMGEAFRADLRALAAVECEGVRVEDEVYAPISYTVDFDRKHWFIRRNPAVIAGGFETKEAAYEWLRQWRTAQSPVAPAK